MKTTSLLLILFIAFKCQAQISTNYYSLTKKVIDQHIELRDYIKYGTTYIMNDSLLYDFEKSAPYEKSFITAFYNFWQGYFLDSISDYHVDTPFLYFIKADEMNAVTTLTPKGLNCIGFNSGLVNSLVYYYSKIGTTINNNTLNNRYSNLPGLLHNSFENIMLQFASSFIIRHEFAHVLQNNYTGKSSNSYEFPTKIITNDYLKYQALEFDADMYAASEVVINALGLWKKWLPETEQTQNNLQLIAEIGLSAIILNIYITCNFNNSRLLQHQTHPEPLARAD